MNKRFAAAIVVVWLIIAAYGAIGDMTHNDAKAYQDHYCQMAAQGLWPDNEYCNE